MMPPEKMAQIGVAMATAIASAIKENPNDNVCVHRALWDGTHARIAELEAALREIARPTYGTEINDSDAERAEVYWGHLTRFQSIANQALK